MYEATRSPEKLNAQLLRRRAVQGVNDVLSSQGPVSPEGPYSLYNYGLWAAIRRPRYTSSYHFA